MKPKLIKCSKVTRFPRAIVNVETLLKRVLHQAKTRKIKKCVIVLLEDDGTLSICHTPGANSQIIGMLEMAKLNLWNEQE